MNLHIRMNLAQSQKSPKKIQGILTSAPRDIFRLFGGNGELFGMGRKALHGVLYLRDEVPGAASF